MASLAFLYELILEDVKVHSGDKLLQAELIARNTSRVIKSPCKLSVSSRVGMTRHDNIFTANKKERVCSYFHHSMA